MRPARIFDADRGQIACVELAGVVHLLFCQGMAQGLRAGAFLPMLALLIGPSGLQR